MHVMQERYTHALGNPCSGCLLENLDGTHILQRDCSPRNWHSLHSVQSGKQVDSFPDDKFGHLHIHHASCIVAQLGLEKDMQVSLVGSLCQCTSLRLPCSQ